jgi:hypothetical protein
MRPATALEITWEIVAAQRAADVHTATPLETATALEVPVASVAVPLVAVVGAGVLVEAAGMEEVVVEVAGAVTEAVAAVPFQMAVRSVPWAVAWAAVASTV